MARRIEIGVASEYAEYVRDVLQSEDKCALGTGDKKSNSVMELKANGVFTVFNVTVPSGALNALLLSLKKYGVGFGVGTVAIYSLDSFSPRLMSAPPAPLNSPSAADVAEKALGGFRFKLATDLFPGFKQFQNARFTTEEIYTNVLAASTMTINTWFNLIGAIVIAAGGLISNYSVFIVAAMLVSPLMGPILGMTFGLRIADWKLFSMSLVNEIKMALTAWSMGVLFGLLLIAHGNPNNGWPATAVRAKNVRDFDLVISILVSSAAGLVLGVNVTTGGVNSLVGVAMSAGLMPPIVNSGMIMVYSWLKEQDPSVRADYMDNAWFSLKWYSSHVLAIIMVSNFIFWLKRITHKFKSADDHNYLNLPSVQEYNTRLAEVTRKVSDASLGGIPETFIGMGVAAEGIISNIANELSGRGGTTIRSEESVHSTAEGGTDFHLLSPQVSSGEEVFGGAEPVSTVRARGSSTGSTGNVELAHVVPMVRKSSKFDQNEGGAGGASEKAASFRAETVARRPRTSSSGGGTRGDATDTFMRNCAAATASVADAAAIDDFVNAAMDDVADPPAALRLRASSLNRLSASDASVEC